MEYFEGEAGPAYWERAIVVVQHFKVRADHVGQCWRRSQSGHCIQPHLVNRMELSRPLQNVSGLSSSMLAVSINSSRG
jgi:hypothetical protein